MNKLKAKDPMAGLQIEIKLVERSKLNKKVEELKNRISITFEAINADIAHQYLEKNIKEGNDVNRNVSYRNIQKLIKEMLSDNWVPEASEIAFDTNGRLIDGQQRLLAITKIDKPIILMIKKGCSPDAFFVMDSGKNRTPSDTATTIIFNGLKLKKPDHVASGIQFLESSRVSNNPNHNRVLVNSDIRKTILDDFMFYYDTEDKIHNWYLSIHRNVQKAAIAAVYYELHKRKQDISEVNLFMNEVFNGNSNFKIIKDLRERLAGNKADKNTKRFLTSIKIYKLLLEMYKTYSNNDLDHKTLKQLLSKI